MRKLLQRGIGKKCWELCRKIVKCRAENKCEICEARNELQVDHCFEESVSRLLFDTKNLTLLCSACHTKKSFKVNGFEKVVDQIVQAREGWKWWNNAMTVAQSMKPCKYTITDLEGIHDNLRRELELIK